MLWESDTCFKGYFFKLKIPFVVKHRVEEFVVGDKNVRTAVAVVVSDAHSHPFSQVRADS